jgi:acyl-coenzyme A thioesterase PaaI-like protein
MEKMTAILRSKFGERLDTFLIPPPVFTFMEGEFIAFDHDEGWLQACFPVKQEYLNPYKMMQGGMIAAAIDNTLGPLSILIAPPNVTRTLEVKYSSPIPLKLKKILVDARLIAREGKELSFRVEVRTEGGKLLTRAKARHWITEFEE